MKILVFSSLYPNNAAPQRGLFVKQRMAHVAALEGHAIKVIAPVPYYPPIPLGWRQRFARVDRHEVIDGVDVYHPRYLMTPKIGMTLYGLFMFLAARPVARSIQRTFDFELIDAHFVYPDGLAALLLGRLLDKPVVISARGSDINQYRTMPLIRPILRRTLCGADAVIAVSQALKDAMVELGVPAPAVSVVPNGVDTHLFRAMDREAARRALGLASGPIVLSVGNLVPAKGFDLLIDAFRALLESSTDKTMTLYVAGDGPQRAALEASAARASLGGRVRFVGAVQHERLVWWYNAADVFCLASSREGHPNVVMEALACGTPVVATRVGGIPEVLRTDRVGLLSEREPRELAAALARALTRSWDRPFIEQYAGEYSWERSARSVAAVFRTVIEARRGRHPSVEAGAGARLRIGDRG